MYYSSAALAPQVVQLVRRARRSERLMLLACALRCGTRVPLALRRHLLGVRDSRASDRSGELVIEQARCFDLRARQ
jgi:uncharacterized metal-binding protein